MKYWIARDEDGRLYLHPIKPYLKNVKPSAYWNNEDENWMQLREESFPEVTFENSPMEVELKLIEKRNTFYFLRQPDHMIECSDHFTGGEDIELIKQKHKIFYTKEEAEQYQRTLGLESEADRRVLNRWFAEAGLAEEYGYVRKKAIIKTGKLIEK